MNAWDAPNDDNLPPGTWKHTCLRPGDEATCPGCRESAIARREFNAAVANGLLRRAKQVERRMSPECRCQIIGWSRDPYESHIPAQAEWEQADDCAVHPSGENHQS